MTRPDDLKSLASGQSHSTPASSSTVGFFQTPPRIQNLFFEDEGFKRIYTAYVPKEVRNAINPDLARFGTLVHAPQVRAWTTDAERNPPCVKTFDTWGRRSNALITSEGWRQLQDLGFKEGIVAIAFENEHGAYSRVYQFLKYHLWTPASALVTCPSAMQDGAARLLAVYLAGKGAKLGAEERHVLESAYSHLTSRDPQHAWTSGQWMTERTGGSDVSGTETQATFTPEFAPDSSTKDIDGLPLGPWLLHGFKWFSSATDAQMSIALAKTPAGTISTFFVPMRRQLASDNSLNELNGITIQRLKSKLGTRAVPTAELVLNDTRAYLLGAPGQGIKNIATILNITRLHNAISAVGYWGGGLAIARAFTRVRKASGRLLSHIPAHMHTLAEEHVKYRGMMHLSFFTAALLGIAETVSDSYTTFKAPHPIDADKTASAAASALGIDTDTAVALLRLLTPIAKAVPARAAIAGLQECMECLGGVGYLENEDIEFNIARLYRDVNVISIWEGTTNVMAEDVLRVLKSHRDGPVTIEAMDRWLAASLERCHFTDDHSADWFREDWRDIKVAVNERTTDELRMRGRGLMWEISDLVISLLLAIDASRDDDPVAWEVYRRWRNRSKSAFRGQLMREELDDDLGQRREEEDGTDMQSEIGWDWDIVFGDDVFEEKAKL